MVGSISVLKVSRPNRSCSAPQASTVPGTVTGAAELVEVIIAHGRVAADPGRRSLPRQGLDVGSHILQGLLIRQGIGHGAHALCLRGGALAPANTGPEVFQLRHDIARLQVSEPGRLELCVALGIVAVTGDAGAKMSLAGLGVALAAGPLGCFVVWRRMAYFGDATAHAAILGVALALAMSLPIALGVLVAAIAMALMVTSLSGRAFTTDTILGVAAHGALAIGLVAVSLSAPGAVNVEAFLFGEILAVGRDDLAVIWGGAILVLALLMWRWRGLLTATLSPDLAYADGHDPKREELILTLALAITVAVALKVVGALLITAMLIIPAATARTFARTPEMMAALAVMIGWGAVYGGISLSFMVDTPTGPTIVATAAMLFVVGTVVGKVVRV